MNRWIELIVTHMLPWPIGVLVGASALSLTIGLIGLWSLWRVRRMLNVVTVIDERVNTLNNSVALLTDTTESCFRALSMQMQFLGSPAGRPTARRPTPAPEAPPATTSSRKAKQRRVVGAARRGEAVAAIAAREDLAETEVALRLHVGRDQQAVEPKRYGSLLS
ncbi:MAG TPA: hypothetical protein VGJ29_00850 [Vicinamibacterales bacterium]|jgi:hypothetical protein